MNKWLYIGTLLVVIIVITIFLRLTPQTIQKTEGHNFIKKESLNREKPLSQVKKTTKPSYSLSHEVKQESISRRRFYQDTNTAFLDNLQSTSVRDRVGTIERAIENEDIENRTFEEYMLQLINTDKDKEVLESALSYFSLTSSPNTFYAVQTVLERDDLSPDVLAYIGEILYEDYKYEQDAISELIENSPTYIKLDNIELATLADDLDEIFYDNQEESDIEVPDDKKEGYL